MSSQTIRLNNGKFAIVTTDLSRIFVRENRYLEGTYNNPGYVDSVLPAGTVMGRVSATQKVKPCDSASTDGSQFPIGILADDFTVTAGSNVIVPICNFGEVIAAKLTFFNGTDTLDSVVSSRSYRDRIAGDSAGIRLIESDELTDYDNY